MPTVGVKGILRYNEPLFIHGDEGEREFRNCFLLFWSSAKMKYSENLLEQNLLERCTHYNAGVLWAFHVRSEFIDTLICMLNVEKKSIAQNWYAWL